MAAHTGLPQSHSSQKEGQRWEDGVLVERGKGRQKLLLQTAICKSPCASELSLVTEPSTAVRAADTP